MLIGLSFDLSRKSTGWVAWQDRLPVKSGIIELPKGYLGEQGDAFERHVGRIWPLRLDWCAWEDARAVSKQHGMITFGLAMLLHIRCWREGVPILGFGQPTVKKALTGWGRATKEEMLVIAQEKWPDLDLKVDDQADALGVGLAFWATQPTVGSDMSTSEPES